ncbi:hypothetical protein FCM35_KLT17764 [Carex littledalei]|uniref:Uncharacterized protein n=1 Tax=Carex littledalei TaxID=544730 RepID=A0A833REA5_9POAL|nr:hypothetical protein FCM35_KLT17764 [Carex littledalei]
MASTPSSPKHSQSNSSSSPEFEFWGLVGTNNPSSLHTNLPSADELFSDGILLPLQNLNIPVSDNKPSSDASNSFIDPSSFPSSSPSPGPASKRWKDIFIKAAGEREKKKEKTRLSVGNNAELNINLWPFSRSRSAGNASSIGSWSKKLPVKLATGRNVSSAPCSRSNSRNGELSGPDGAQISTSTASSMIKRWAQTGRLTPTTGIRVGRAGPVWQLRRKKQQQVPQQEIGEMKEKDGADKKDANCGNGGVKILNLNVNTCIGYRNQASCSDGAAAGSGGNAGMFNFKAIFSKKVY